MSDLIHRLRGSVLFRAAFFVPTVIILLFAGFNLTAAPDPARVAAAVQLGVVNLDEGQTFPPINVADRLMQGLGQQMPFTVVKYDDEDTAAAALEAGAITAYILFPASFSKQAFGSDPVDLKVVTTGNAPMAEASIAGQLPTMLQTGVSAAVNGLRLAMAKGQMPDGALPVKLDASMIHAPANPAASMAGFAASYTIWLSAAVGALLLFIASRGAGPAAPLALVKTAVPIVATGVSMAVLALILSWTAGLEEGALTFWLTTWGIAFCLALFFGGLFAVSGFFALIIALPMVFYQGAIGGTQIPYAAAPDWLQSLTLGLPFDQLGPVLRSMIVGGSATPDWTVYGLAGLLGLVLIWAGSFIWARGTATVE